jgi:Arc/MetJ family transcription regulator
MNHMNDDEAVDTFRQTVARIVRRLLDERQEEQQQQQQEEEIPCHSVA